MQDGIDFGLDDGWLISVFRATLVGGWCRRGGTVSCRPMPSLLVTMGLSLIHI